jgi:hypothetical protein
MVRASRSSQKVRSHRETKQTEKGSITNSWKSQYVCTHLESIQVKEQLKELNKMILTTYGLTQIGNKYYYAMHGQAFIVQLLPHPIAWRKTPSSSWQRTHGNVLGFDMLGFGLLELDPLADFDRSSIKVNRLVPSTGRFEFEPDWNDTIPFPSWQKDSNWRELVSDLMSQVDPTVLEKLRKFSHFHWSLLEAIHEWPSFSNLLDTNPALAVCLAGRIRVGAQPGERRPQLDYGRLVPRSEREIAAALGFGGSDNVVGIMRKLPPDACKPLDLVGLADLIKNSETRKTLIAAQVISYPALLLLRNPYLGPHLTGSFLSDFASAFPHSLDILTCPWGPLLRGGGKGDEFTWRYQQALDVVEFGEDPTIYSSEDLKEKHSTIFMQAYNTRYHS